MNLKYLPLAAALGASAPAMAITVNISGYTFASPATVTFHDALTGVGYSGTAGVFNGTLTDSTVHKQVATARSLELQGPSTTSFSAYCAEITQSVYAGRDYQYSFASGSDYFKSRKLTDLSRLFTGAAGFVVDKATSAAMQAAVWEIIYEPGSVYDLSGGQVVVAPRNAGDRVAFAEVDSFLAHLSSYRPAYRIEVLTNPTSQDLLVATIPEPGTWALLVGGLAVIGIQARRRAR